MGDLAALELLPSISRVLDDVLSVDPGIRLYQGAVGAVTALRGSDGTRYVLKVYRAGAGEVAATEYVALQRIRDQSDLPVPTPIVHGVTEGHGASPFLLMTYLPGDRWADRRGQLSATDRWRLAGEAAQMLQHLHAITGEGFGSLLHPNLNSVWASVQDRFMALAAEYVTCGGNTDIVARVERLLRDTRHEINTCTSAVLCHNDFIDGNLLLASEGQPTITGMVDLETASWNDPLADLANTARHLRDHDPAAAAHLIEMYGATTPAARSRLAVHDTLHTLHQRNWIAHDQPPGWCEGIQVLDERLRNVEFP